MSQVLFNEETKAFFGGVCVCLQHVAGHDNGVMWREIVSSVGIDKLVEYATAIESNERELIALDKYLKIEYGKKLTRENKLVNA